MKFKLFLFSLGFASLGYSQSVLDSVRIAEHITVTHTDAMMWIKRYQADIDKYDAENKTLRDRSCDVLFLGSSSINLWDNIHEDLAPLRIIRRSYGGSTIRDNIYNYNTKTRGYKPGKIAIYIENDLGKFRESISPGETYDVQGICSDAAKRLSPSTCIPDFFQTLFCKAGSIARPANYKQAVAGLCKTNSFCRVYRYYPSDV